jgi:hypothetical protein
VTRNASQSHSCRYGEMFSIPSAAITGAIPAWATWRQHRDAALPFALATPRSIRRLLEYRCLISSTDSLKSARRLLVRFNVFSYILNVLLTGRKIPHSGGAVKRAMIRGYNAKLSVAGYDDILPYKLPRYFCGMPCGDSIRVRVMFCLRRSKKRGSLYHATALSAFRSWSNRANAC